MANRRVSQWRGQISSRAIGLASGANIVDKRSFKEVVVFAFDQQIGVKKGSNFEGVKILCKEVVAV